jgi:hypothetical protein
LVHASKQTGGLVLPLGGGGVAGGGVIVMWISKLHDDGGSTSAPLSHELCQHDTTKRKIAHQRQRCSWRAQEGERGVEGNSAIVPLFLFWGSCLSQLSSWAHFLLVFKSGAITMFLVSDVVINGVTCLVIGGTINLLRFFLLVIFLAL